MQSSSVLPFKDREINKFYAKIRQQIDRQKLDIDQSKVEVSLGLTDDKYYGEVTKDEFKKILESYDKQQKSVDTKNSPTTCKGVIGGNYDKLLHSKQGFHHFGSAAHLVRNLGLNDSKRESFLGGPTLFGFHDIDLKGLKKNQERLSILYLIKKGEEHLDKHELKYALKYIKDAQGLDPNNPKVLVAFGRYHHLQKEHENAVEYVKKALKIKPELIEDPVVKTTISESIYNHGFKLYQRQEFQQALETFCETISFNQDHDGAKLHRDLCIRKINEATLFAPKPPAYRK